MTFLWIVLGVLYVACWLYFGLATFRRGHYWMFWIGIVFRSSGSSERSSHPRDRARHESPGPRGDINHQRAELAH